MFVSPESSPGRNFYPRPPRGGRRNGSWPNKASISYFYPRPPRGGRRCPAALPQHHLPISIHALREEGDIGSISRGGLTKISIHALREEGDICGPTAHTAMTYFYPRPPRGGRQIALDHGNPEQIFLSTPSARRATRFSGRSAERDQHFYPRPPRGGRPQSMFPGRSVGRFLSTPSARRAT